MGKGFCAQGLWALLILASSTAMAKEPIEGLWRTQPDVNGLMAIVETRPCGLALCGTIRQMLDGRGKPVQHDAVGRVMFDDVFAVSGKTYQGHVFLRNQTQTDHARSVKMTARRLRLHVQECVGSVCDFQVWRRVQMSP